MRRLALTRGDPIRNMHLPEKVRLDEGRRGGGAGEGGSIRNMNLPEKVRGDEGREGSAVSLDL